MDGLFQRRYFLATSLCANLVQRFWAIGNSEHNLRTLSLMCAVLLSTLARMTPGASASRELIAMNRQANVLGLGLDWLNMLTIAHLDRDGYKFLERVAFRANFVAAFGLWAENLYALSVGTLPSLFDRTKAIYLLALRSLMLAFGSLVATHEGF